jgi:hypothetical protein
VPPNKDLYNNCGFVTIILWKKTQLETFLGQPALQSMRKDHFLAKRTFAGCGFTIPHPKIVAF